jgi:hypothetical protein
MSGIVQYFRESGIESGIASEREREREREWDSEREREGEGVREIM